MLTFERLITRTGYGRPYLYVYVIKDYQFAKFFTSSGFWNADFSKAAQFLYFDDAKAFAEKHFDGIEDHYQIVRIRFSLDKIVTMKEKTVDAPVRV